MSHVSPNVRAVVPQVREIVGRLRESRQTLMFSATLPRSLADFAAAGLSSPQLVRLDADRKLSPDLGLAFFTGVVLGFRY
jgi:ATP-dependent RNA helicase DDX54/DBP10